MSTYDALIQLLDRANASPAGLKIKTKDGDALRRRLYVALRLVREQGDDRFSGLTLRLSPDSDKILEIHKKVNSRPAPDGPPESGVEKSENQ